MPWKVFFSLLLAVLGLGALTVGVAAELLPKADHQNALRLFFTGAALIALAWRNRARRH